MMNWIYTWYNPRVDPDARELAGHVAGLFLEGIEAAPAVPNHRDRARAVTKLSARSRTNGIRG